VRRPACRSAHFTVLCNPYLEFFRRLPPSFRRDPSVPIGADELQLPGWLAWKAAVARHFAWAVPTEPAIATIRRHADRVLEIGAGSGYWAWLMRQGGIAVAAYDTSPPPSTWTEVRSGDASMASYDPADALFLCWPPWASDMAYEALARHRGDRFIFVGEWMGGCATPDFFRLLTARFEAIDSIALPQWYMRNDFLAVFRRRGRAS